MLNITRRPHRLGEYAPASTPLRWLFNVLTVNP